MKKIVVCGAGGFIGGHLVRRLKQDGHRVLGIDRKQPEFEKSAADEFVTFDLRAMKANDAFFTGVDEVYQLACEVGGLGYIMNRDNDAEMLRNSVQINLAVLEACRFQKVPKVFFASSACVYPSIDESVRPLTEGFRHGGDVHEYAYMVDGSVQERTFATACRESDVPPANPDNEYAWEKIFSERLYQAYARNRGVQARIGRFHNCYGPLGTWTGGREKAPAAMCRKVAQAQEDGEIELWGDGQQTRSFMYVDDAVEGAVRLMASDFAGPVNIGSSEMVTVNRLVDIVCEVAGKAVKVRNVAGPVGVRGRNSDNTLILEKLSWAPSIGLRMGIEKTYSWIAEQVDKASAEV